MPDRVLVDTHLPDADGIDLLTVLRAPPLSCAAPVIAVSAAAGPDDLRRARGRFRRAAAPAQCRCSRNCIGTPPRSSPPSSSHCRVVDADCSISEADAE